MTRLLALLLAGGVLAGTAVAQPSVSPLPETKIAPAGAPHDATAASAPCESCGTIVAINRVIVEGEKPPLAALTDRVLERATVDGTTVSRAPAGGPRQRYEVLVRLSAGTQQVVMLDELPKLVVGQRVRIADGVVVPDRG